VVRLPESFPAVSEDQESHWMQRAFNREVGNYYAYMSRGSTLCPRAKPDEGFRHLGQRPELGRYIALQVGDPLEGNQCDSHQTPRQVMMAKAITNRLREFPSTSTIPILLSLVNVECFFPAGLPIRGARCHSSLHSNEQTRSCLDRAWRGRLYGYQLHARSIPYVWPYFKSRGIDLSLFQSDDALVTMEHAASDSGLRS